MQVRLSPDLKNYVREQVTSGSFTSETEVIVKALQEMRENERKAKLSQLREAVAIGVAQAERGEFVDQTVSEIFAEVKREYREAL